MRSYNAKAAAHEMSALWGKSTYQANSDGNPKYNETVDPISVSPLGSQEPILLAAANKTFRGVGFRHQQSLKLAPGGFLLLKTYFVGPTKFATRSEYSGAEY